MTLSVEAAYILHHDKYLGAVVMPKNDSLNAAFDLPDKISDLLTKRMIVMIKFAAMLK